MRNPFLTPELRELLQDGQTDELRSVIEDLHPNDAAQYVAGLEDHEIVKVMAALPVEVERDLFTYFDPDVQEEIVQGLGRDRVGSLLQALGSDDRYEFLDRLDDRVRDRLVPLLKQAQRRDLTRRDRFEDDQVGSILTTDYCELRGEMTAGEALDEIRRQEPSKETIYYSYIVGDHGELRGFVSLRKLIRARPGDAVESIMKTEPVSIGVSEDQEKAVQLIREYDLLALPVVDASGVLVGMVTYDDAADIQEEEETEDVERMAGLSGDPDTDGGYLGESVVRQISRRVPLIAFLAIFNLTTAFVIREYEEQLTYSTLIALLPIVMATGGMVGGQASVLVVRGLTLGDLGPRALPGVIWKELRVAGGIALVLGGIVFVEALVLASSDHELATDLVLRLGLAVALAMAGHVVGSGLFGVAIPLAAKALGRDPAIVSTPAVTAVADLFGASVFCLIVLAML